MNERREIKSLYRGTQIVWYLVGIINGLLVFRFILKLFGANPAAGFSRFIYSITYPFAQPFLNVFKVTSIEGKIFEWTTLLAVVVYWLLAVAIVKLFIMGKPISTAEAAAKLDEQEEEI